MSELWTVLPEEGEVLGRSIYKTSAASSQAGQCKSEEGIRSGGHGFSAARKSLSFYSEGWPSYWKKR